MTLQEIPYMDKGIAISVTEYTEDIKCLEW